MPDYPPSPFDGQICVPGHKVLAHTSIHEAGHAVAAVDLEVPFVSVSVTDGSEPGVMGGVLMTLDPQVWMPRRPKDAALVMWAGAAAEHVDLDECVVVASYRYDIKLLEFGLGIDVENADEVKTAIGESMDQTKERTLRWASENIDRIRLVAHALVENRTVTSDEVRLVLDAPVPPTQ